MAGVEPAFRSASIGVHAGFSSACSFAAAGLVGIQPLASGHSIHYQFTYDYGFPTTTMPFPAHFEPFRGK